MNQSRECMIIQYIWEGMYKKHPMLREGQALSHAVRLFSSELGDEMYEKGVDPYYFTKDKIEVTIEWLKNKFPFNKEEN